MTRYKGDSRRLGLPWVVGVIGLSIAIPVCAQQSPAPVAAKPLTVEQRLARLERLSANQNLVELFMRLESLQKEVEAMRGQLEMQTHESTSLKNRQRELYLDVDMRLQQLETAAKKVLDQSSDGSYGDGADDTLSSADDAASSGADAVGDGQTADEGAAYQRAFSFLKKGDYSSAISAFTEFLARFPNSGYSANAQYWLGEARYVKRDFGPAVTEFEKVVKSFPDSSKAADAQLKIGFSYYELSEWAKARKALEAVPLRFSGTTAARLAEKRLQQMKLEGKI